MTRHRTNAGGSALAGGPAFGRHPDWHVLLNRVRAWQGGVVPAKVRYIGDYVTGDAPVLYLESFAHGWEALGNSESEWLGFVPVRNIIIEGYFLDPDGNPFVRVRKSGDDLGVLVSRPAITMLKTGDPAGLALRDVDDALKQISKRYSISDTPVIPPLDTSRLASLLATDRERDRLKAIAVELIRRRRAQVSQDHVAEIDSNLTAGLYSQALGSLMIGMRNAGLELPEATSGELQRLRVALRAENL